MPKVSKQRSWWWIHFKESPNPALTKSGKHMIYCVKCLEVHVAAVKAQDRQDIIYGQRHVERDQAQIEEYLWSIPANAKDNTNGFGWITSATTTALNHIRSCQYVTPEIRATAHARHRLSSQQSHQTGISGTTETIPLSPLPTINFATNQWSSSSGSFSQDSPASSGSQQSGATGLTPLSGMSRSSSGLNQSSTLDWTPTKQKRFESYIVRLTASAGFPLSWVENVEWIDFCQEFLPAAKSPSRKTLTKRLLPLTVKELRSAARAAAEGHEATLQADGWTGINNHHILAFMITGDNKVHTVKVTDTTLERKTANNFLRHMENTIQEVEQDWKAKVVAVVTDASGECRKARRDLGKKYPHLVMLDCYAHQINLIVGDYFRADSGILMNYADKATKVIAWLRSKTLLLGMIQKIRIDAKLSPLSVIRAVLTRWTAHYMAYKRLLELHSTLDSIIANDAMQAIDENKIVITGDAKAKQKAREMVEIIKDPLFWHSLARMKRHLEPLAIATNITQSSFCRLDEVLLTFGQLMMQYKAMTDPEDQYQCSAIITSIETRWAKADQELFIAAVILNPFYQSTPFAPLPFLNRAGIHAMLERLWIRLYRTPLPTSFHEEVTNYLLCTGSFVNLKATCDMIEVAAAKLNNSPNPISVYEEFSFVGRDPIPLIRLANHILSISANSASCERLFSIFGNILTKLRNRLGVQNMNLLAELKIRIRDQHAQKKSSQRLKTLFHNRSQIPSTTVESPPSTIVEPLAPSTSYSGSNYSLPDIPPPRHGPHNYVDNELQIRLDNTSEHGEDYQIPLSNSFRSMVDHQLHMVEQDTDSTVQASNSVIGLVSIQQLFDFSHSHWTGVYSRSAIRSFDEELQLYELLELDADGEEDLDACGLFDESMDDILIG